LRATIAEIDPLLALRQVQPMDAVISNVQAPRRFNTDLITAFALAVTGIYAVVTFSVSLRTSELAVRVAQSNATDNSVLPESASYFECPPEQ